MLTNSDIVTVFVVAMICVTILGIAEYYFKYKAKKEHEKEEHVEKKET